MQIEHECPQCGAPVVLDETDTLLSCGFCKTRSFMQPEDYFRYALSPRDPFLDDVYYVPYWRYRGMHFLCKTSGIESGLVDKTFLAVENPGIPQSLGLRVQSLKLTFARPARGAHYLKPATAFDISQAAAKSTVEYSLVRSPQTRVVRTSEDDYDIVPDVRLEVHEERLYHEVFITDALSIIYAPFYVRDNRVHDGVTDDILVAEPRSITGTETVVGDWPVKFLPILCPNCGWDTLSGRDSRIVFCTKCDRAWIVTEKGLTSSEFYSRASSRPADGASTVHLPFWKIAVAMTGARLDSYADFIRFTNLPRALLPSFEDKPFFFWFPAFKTTPAVFLRIARQVTIADPEGSDPALPHTDIQPVNVPLEDAFTMAKTLIADLTLRKKTFIPTLSDVSISIRQASLVLLPFTDKNQELIEPDMNLSLFKNAIKD
jgi:ribosomal protein S27AE